MIFSLCFNAHGNPQPGFHFWISFAFSAKITQIFDEVTRSPQLSVIPGTGIATVSPGKWYGTSEFNYIFSSYNLFTLFFILKILKYIQIVSISDSSREETYGNKQHNNFKWGTEFHRVFLSDVFGDYIPSFNYLVVPLNKYSKQDLIEKNDELSLIFLINQLQNSSGFHALKDIPKEYTEHLTENT